MSLRLLRIGREVERCSEAELWVPEPVVQGCL